MLEPIFHPLDDDIWCIDALYTRADVACCYLMGDAGEYALVETGTSLSVPNILATLEALEISPEQLRYVIPTHVHLDHAGGAGQLMQAFPEATLMIHPRGARHLIDPTRLVASSEQVYGKKLFEKLYGEILPVDETRVRTLEDGEHFELGTRRLRVLHTRGHAEHHFCIFDERSQSWFSGDMFGISYPALRLEKGSFVIPATTPTQFDPASYKASVEMLAEARPRYCYLTHFNALPFAPEQVDMLCTQLDAYAALGKRASDETESATHEGITQGIVQLAETAIASLSDAATAREVIATLRHDAALNAQGIAWWRDHPRE